jgi:hypothetical protein
LTIKQSVADSLTPLPWKNDAGFWMLDAGCWIKDSIHVLYIKLLL